ncbi:MAG: hypothetical protein R3F55_18600 [Alphaproteobacteria bacterium]
MPVRSFFAAVLACVAVAAVAAPAGAQPSKPVSATINALALAPMPPAASIEIVSYDDSDLALAIADVARQTLAAKGYQVGAGGQLLLGLELRDRDTITRDVPTLGSATADTRLDEGSVRVNLFADSEDSVLGGRVNPDSVDALQFGIFVTLNDRSTGRRVWQGEIMADISGSSREEAGPLLVSAIANRLGEPISRESLVLE